MMMTWKAPEPPRRGACVFLDRDGVVNERIAGGYVLDWSDFLWRPDAVEALRVLSESGLPLVIVSNQSCVGRGLLTKDALGRIMQKMRAYLSERGVEFAAWYVCPHAPEERCACRKPGAEMLFAAERDLGVDAKTSFLIGDSESDMQAGRAAGSECFLIPPDVPGKFLEVAREIAKRAKNGNRQSVG